ncbi:SgcJ/EcaC family oxidoreductase [Dactylosporangium aurantiacum]|uniref:SgcJ/EcaC family oxidoreductase n=1 Tax=Dactylosporangium aurantiacum TaxID=35754 RepID=A0A9Q9IJT3_9ACTN|nr:SgcJ/EcaC family oxidoreductase [Dactylosporangium aurantiacum]MDG6104089.1 SgcJ/EcaC family oxidoreductase [Dactylosporangium aurantiacum]UWZ56896.1 SgcJ/EcaC family oxidoreductase [Dactylosporangium aurantiacum]
MDRETDVAQLRALFASTIEAWDRADAQAYAAAFTEDADYTIFVGTRYRGRDKIADVHDALWRRFLKGSRLVGAVTDIRFVTDDVAVLTSQGRVRTSRLSGRRLDKAQTFVAVRRDGRWLFTAFHNSPRKRLLEWISARTEPRTAPNT